MFLLILMLFVNDVIAFDRVESSIHYERQVVICHDYAVADQLVIHLHCVVVQASVLLVSNEDIID